MKIKGPLMSEKASGTFADVSTFSQRKTGQQARYQKKQQDKMSVAQLAQRADFEKASLSCRFFNFGEAFFGVALFGQDIADYNLAVQGKNLTGYNLCIKESIKEL